MCVNGGSRGRSCGRAGSDGPFLANVGGRNLLVGLEKKIMGEIWALGKNGEFAPFLIYRGLKGKIRG